MWFVVVSAKLLQAAICEKRKLLDQQLDLKLTCQVLLCLIIVLTSDYDWRYVYIALVIVLALSLSSLSSTSVTALR